MTLPHNQIRAIKAKFGADAANSTFVRNARSMKEAEFRARKENERQHGVTTVSPKDVLEIKQGGELAGQPGVSSQFDKVFKENLQEKVRMEKAKGKGGISSAQLNLVLQKSESQTKSKIIVG